MILFDDMNVVEVEEDAMNLTSLYNFAQPFKDSPFSRAEILPNSATGKKPLILAECLVNSKEAII